MSQALGRVLHVCGLTGSSGLPGPYPTRTRPCRVAWAGPWEDCGRGPGERLALPNFQDFAYDKSQPQILWGFPCLWLIHPLESVALELFRHYFSRGFPRPSIHAVSGTFISHWPAVPEVWLHLSHFFSLLFSLGGSFLLPPVHTHFLLLFLLFSELTYPLSF